MTEKTAIKKNNTRKSILRILAVAVDFIILVFPVQLIMLGVIGASVFISNFLFTLLFAVYGVAMVSITTYGQTAGKMFSKTAVRDSTGTKAVLMYTGLRELTKILYFIPFIGWAVGVASIVVMFITGRAIHDYLSDTSVFFIWEIPKNEESEEARGR